MKETYIAPEVEHITFGKEDIIATSGDEPTSDATTATLNTEVLR